MTQSFTQHDETETAFTSDVLLASYSNDRVEIDQEPIMGAEDFSLVLEHVPGTYFYLGASPDHIDLEAAPQLHSPHALFDEAVSLDQAVALAQLAFQRLQSASVDEPSILIGGTQ